MTLLSLKNRILESSIGYSLWSAPLTKKKVGEVRAMLQRIGKQNCSVLDVGCGPGSNADLFEGWDYLGIDHNPDYIQLARSKYPSMEFRTGDATDLGLNGQTFELVLINSLLHHLNDDECKRLFNGLRPLLATDAKLILQEPIIPRRSERLRWFLMEQDRGDHFRTVEGWKQLFAEGGFQIAADQLYFLKLAGTVTGWQMYSVLLSVSEEEVAG